MEKRIQSADVARCTVPECVYNRNSHCYALAITVGNGEQPECDTFYSANNHVPRRDATAGVGACKVYPCRYNADYACQAEHIYVGYTDNSSYVGCLSYRPPGE